MNSPLSRLGAWIDSESVRHYQTVIYTAYFMAGIWTMVSGVPGPVSLALGRVFEVAWVWLLIGGPLLTFGGRFWRSLGGLWIELAGDLCVLFASLTFVAAVEQTVYATRAAFAVWVVAGLAVCALGVVVRGIRKIRLATVLVMSEERRCATNE